jgi:serine/threonine protein kinase
MELCQGNLAKLLKRRKKLTEFEACYYVTQIINGVEAVHAQNVVHRDVKIANLMLDENMQVKLADFGLAKRLKMGRRARTLCGTPNYMSPEILSKKGHSYETDIWAIGVITYALLFGKPPFEGEQVN